MELAQELAEIVVDSQAYPPSESIQPKFDSGKMNEAKNSTIMEEAQIVADLEASPVSESMQPELNRGKTNEANNSTIMEETQRVADLEASPVSESMQPELNRGKTNEAKNSTIMEGDQIVADLEASLQRELDTLWGEANEPENFTIFRTPHNISQTKKKLFEPSVVSIGPFHHGQKHLQALEQQKRRFLRDFLFRGVSLNLCIREMKHLETRTRRCYSETFDNLDSSAFVEMMLLDGCFVFEYYYNHFNRYFNNIDEVGWNSQYIKSDFLLLENQIPFFIVDKLAELNGYSQEYRMSFIKNIARTFLQEPQMEEDISVDPPDEIHHLLHLCYHILVPHPEKPNVLKGNLLHRFRSSALRGRSPHSTSGSSSEPLPNSTGNLCAMVIPSATELKESGLKFTPNNNPKHMLDISFEYGVLKIPTLEITDSTKPLFANLLAFEQSKYGKKTHPFTSFVGFLDKLVNTQNDVTILQKCGIFKNWLGSEEELTHFINQVTEGGGFSEDHYLAELNREVNRYIGSRWHRHRAKLIRDYFSNPWAAISLIAALILLVLTCVQSFYAVYAYKFPPSS